MTGPRGFDGHERHFESMKWVLPLLFEMEATHFIVHFSPVSFPNLQYVLEEARGFVDDWIEQGYITGGQVTDSKGAGCKSQHYSGVDV